MMVLESKAKIVSDLTAQLESSQLAILTDYRGLTVTEISGLRKQLRQQGASYVVAKNTLLKLAATQRGLEGLDQFLSGPTAVAFSGKDPAQLAKAISDYVKVSKTVTVKGAVFHGSVLAASRVAELGDLPSRDVMLARLMGTMQAPMVGIVSVLNNTIAGFVRVLDGRRQQLEGAA